MGKPTAHGVLSGPFTPGKNFGEDASPASCLGDEATRKAELMTPVTPIYVAVFFFQILMHFSPLILEYCKKKNSNTTEKVQILPFQREPLPIAGYIVVQT